MSWIEENRQLVHKNLTARGKWKYFSPLVLAQYRVTLPLLLENACGNLLDVGCGSMPFKSQILPLVSRYDGLDLFALHEDIQLVCDAQHICLRDSSYQTVICLEVLEHTPEPERVLSEIYRVLSPGGMCVVTVPHLSRIHDAPYDYHRFTSYGIAYLLTKVGFRIEKTVHKGGLFSFLGHQFSTAFLSLFARIPLLDEIAFWLNRVMVSRFCLWLDSKLDRGGRFACGYTLTARKVDIS